MFNSDEYLGIAILVVQGLLIGIIIGGIWGYNAGYDNACESVSRVTVKVHDEYRCLDLETYSTIEEWYDE